MHNFSGSRSEMLINKVTGNVVSAIVITMGDSQLLGSIAVINM